MSNGSTTTVTLALRDPLDLDATLSMGQVFGWRPAGDGYLGTIEGGLVHVRVEDQVLVAKGRLPEEVLADRVSRYFDVERDIATLHRRLSADPHVAAAIRRCPGLRRLRVPFWECLAGFLLSSVNNIRRIERIVAQLSETFGEPAEIDGWPGHAFPRPERLVDVPLPKLYDCGTGFRAKGLQGAARAIVEGSVSAAELVSLDVDSARRQLTALYGVGPKIADCVLLYGLGFGEAFPVDVWMKREMERLYFGGEPTSTERIQAFARDRFGEDAGDAQLYLYDAARRRRRETRQVPNGRRKTGQRR